MTCSNPPSVIAADTGASFTNCGRAPTTLRIFMPAIITAGRAGTSTATRASTCTATRRKPVAPIRRRRDSGEALFRHPALTGHLCSGTRNRQLLPQTTDVRDDETRINGEKIAQNPLSGLLLPAEPVQRGIQGAGHRERARPLRLGRDRVHRAPP